MSLFVLKKRKQYLRIFFSTVNQKMIKTVSYIGKSTIGYVFKQHYLVSRSRRVINIGKQVIGAVNPVPPQPSIPLDTKPSLQQKGDLDVDWKGMDMEALSQLPADKLNKIINIVKHPHLSIQTGSSYFQRQVQSLNNQIDSEELPQKSVALLYQFEIQQNPEIKQLIVHCFKNIDKPANLENIVQPSFIKKLKLIHEAAKDAGYLISRQDQVAVESIKTRSIQYEVGVAVYRNRSKNSEYDNYIIQESVVENPNKSKLLGEQDSKIPIRQIIKKRRPKTYSHSLRVQVMLEVRLNGKRRNVKIQFDGPGIDKKSLSQVGMADPEYRIIDIDGIMNGNPTIRPLFSF